MNTLALDVAEDLGKCAGCGNRITGAIRVGSHKGLDQGVCPLCGDSLCENCRDYHAEPEPECKQ